MYRRQRLIIVRRGATELFQELQAYFASDPNTQVISDRRGGDERRKVVQAVPGERRRGQRRMPVDPTILETRGFFVTRAAGRGGRG
ncbi:MAG: hypothetical protein HYS14_06560 [Candidatus Rokubacteria bacterium]|nr:hypothetical protein [Candidatus Rokubacteria bacterium]